MNKTSKDLISLLKMLLTCNYEKLDNPNYNEIYKLAKFHSIQNMLYYAIMAYIDKFSLTSQVEPELLKKLASDNKNAIAKAAYQEEEKEAIFKELEANNIKYMPMKGSIIKYLYPSIDMRSMADLDIYFDDLRSAEVRKILINLGYEVESYKKSNHLFSASWLRTHEARSREGGGTGHGTQWQAGRKKLHVLRESIDRSFRTEH